MEKLISKITKPKMLKAYPFYKLDEMFVILPDETILHEAEKDLPASTSGSYLGFCFIDGVPMIAINAFFNKDTNEYELIEDKAFFIAVEQLENLKVSLIKPNKRLMQHPIIQNIRRFYGSIVGVRATRLHRWCDENRIYGQPDIIACFVLDEKKEAVEDLLPVENIKYAGNNTWQGILVYDSDKLQLKKGDTVGLTAMSHKDDNQNLTGSFVVDTGINNEPPKIFIMPYEQEESTARKFYSLSCSSCGYEKTFYLGRGANTEREFGVIASNLNEYGAEPFAQDSLVDAGKVEIDFRRELYYCRHCGQIETKFKTRYILEDHTVSIQYFCSECGEGLSQVKPAEIKKLACPNCKETLKIKESGKWDIVPPEDGNYC